jgi:hypothetical protein
MKKNYQRLKQPCPKELTDTLLSFLKRKFYTEQDGEKHFQQDRSRLLAWVVLWPASWLNSKGVTLHGDAYREIFFKVMFQADAHRSERIQYRPAWLKMVLQSHFRIHGEEYLAEGKNLRNITDHLLLVAGQARQPQADPVRQMADARQILTSLQPKKRSKKAVKTAPQGILNLDLKLA